MHKNKIHFFSTALAFALLIGFSSSPCWGGLSFILKPSFNFTKTSSTFENLDHGNFKETAPTNFWLENREATTFALSSNLIWQPEKMNFYGELTYRYGWLLDGREIVYPLRWSQNGYSEYLGFEIGYIFDVCKRFQIIPYVAFGGTYFHSKIKHQHVTHSNPVCFIDQDGGISKTLLYAPRIGLELDFTSTFCHDTKILFAASYDFTYLYGHGQYKVPHFILTDDPNRSNYGFRTHYRDLIGHLFQIAAGYNVTEKWLVGLTLAYNTIYNTHSLPVKLQHNRKIVETGQFTKSQYHVISDYNSQTYSVILNIAYNFSGQAAGVGLVR